MCPPCDHAHPPCDPAHPPCDPAQPPCDHAQSLCDHAQPESNRNLILPVPCFRTSAGSRWPSRRNPLFPTDRAGTPEVRSPFSALQPALSGLVQLGLTVPTPPALSHLLACSSVPLPGVIGDQSHGFMCLQIGPEGRSTILGRKLSSSVTLRGAQGGPGGNFLLCQLLVSSCDLYHILNLDVWIYKMGKVTPAPENSCEAWR